MKNIVIATNTDVGYYKVLQESCHRHNLELIPLGLGQKWTGFEMKFRLWREYFKSLPNDDEIVMLNDAYDVVIVEDAHKIIQKFKAFNKPIVFGRQYGHATELVFINCDGQVICSGNIIGYVGYLKKFIDILFQNKHIWKQYLNDDQQIVNAICEKSNFFKKHTAIDTKQDIFFATHLGDLLRFDYLINSNIRNLKMEDNQIKKISDDKPISVLHLAADINANKYLKYLKYTTVNKHWLQDKFWYKLKQILLLLLTAINKYKLKIFIILVALIIFSYIEPRNYYKQSKIKK